MRKLAVFVTREWRAQANIALLALLIAAVPWLVRFFPGVGPDRAAVTRIVAASTAVLFALIASILLGATMIASDVGERRMSFYTRLPLPASTIVLGKLMGNAMLIAAGSMAIGLAAVLAWPRWCAALFPVVALLLVLSHYISLSVRAGGARFLVDLTLLAAAVLAAVISTLPFYRLWGRPAGHAIAGAWVVAWMAALLFAGIRQVRSGAFDVRAAATRARAALWRTTYGVALLIDVAYAVYAFALPSLGATFAYPIHREWLAAWSIDPFRLDGMRLHLIRLRDGERIRVPHPAISMTGLPPTLSGDGRHAFWNRWTEDGHSSILHVNFVTGEIEDLPIQPGIRAVAPDGSSLATTAYDESAVYLYAIPGGRKVREIPLSRQGRVQLFFDRAGHLHIVEFGPAGMRLRLIDPRSGTEKAVMVPVDWAEAYYGLFAASPGGERLAVSKATVERDPRSAVTGRHFSVLLFDASAHLVREITAETAPRALAFLNDGRLAVLSSQLGGPLVLHVFDTSGKEQRSIVVGDNRLIPELSTAGSFVIVGRGGFAVVDVNLGTVWAIQQWDVIVEAPGRILASDGANVRRLDLRTGGNRIVSQGHQTSPWIMEHLQRHGGF